jgi:hypothetical protein
MLVQYVLPDCLKNLLKSEHDGGYRNQLSGVLSNNGLVTVAI